MTVALVPPNPKELESARSTLRSLASCGTRSRSQPGEGLSRLSVGGTTPWLMARMEKISSTLPARAEQVPDG